ncbi:heterokaryon incompatibility protein-domain-containing protein [Halenospora varia]|nr:heterokaryon incompatibility protein-domain-containing protein [Halenospora varia]
MELQSSTLRSYNYQSLPTCSSFRILELLAGQAEDEISIRLHLADWKSPPSYEAISYAWGSTKVKADILCHGSTLRITPNLRHALLKMRRKDSSRYLWADAVCINQEDILERGHQVNIMIKIYQNASRVLVWLGSDEYRHAERAMEAVDEISNVCCQESNILVPDLRMVEDLGSLITTQFKNLECNSPDSWYSVSWLFSRKWFSRIWVFQEVNAGPEVLVMCGESEISWDAVAMAAYYIRTFPELYNSNSLPQSFYENATYMRTFFDDNDSILHLLHIARRLHCHDPRDRVYAMLGMSMFATLDPPIQANYVKSKLDVYQEVAEVYFKHYSNLDILSLVQHDQSLDEDFPSWVPFWDRGMRRNVILDELSPRKHIMSLNIPSTVTIDPQARILMVTGFTFDTITASEEINRQEWYLSPSDNMDLHPVLQFWMRNYKSAARYVTHELVTDVYGKVLTAGLDYKGTEPVTSTRGIQTDFNEFILHLLERAGENAGLYPQVQRKRGYGNALSFQHRAAQIGWNRSFFATSKGYLGLGPNTLRVGDAVTILRGGAIPYIQRSRNGHHQLVGEAYVHGIMEAELTKQWRNGQLKEEIFEIR